MGLSNHFLIDLELYNEVFEIIDSCTFSAKSISPTMWMVFELIHETFKDRAEVYVEGNYQLHITLLDTVKANTKTLM